MKALFIYFWPVIENKFRLEAMKESSNNYVTERLNNMNETVLK
jgi:hypothetical protein